MIDIAATLLWYLRRYLLQRSGNYVANWSNSQSCLTRTCLQAAIFAKKEIRFIRVAQGICFIRVQRKGMEG
jgi:hypothetical protein